MKRKRGVSIIVVIGLIAMGLFYSIPNNTIASENITLEPTQSDATGVDVASSFLLTLIEQRGLDEVKEGLKISPEIQYEVVEEAKGRFIIKPQEELERNKIYSFSLSLKGIDTAWAFQTQKTFEVLGTLPRDKSQRIPVNSGIEMTFTHEGVKDIEDYFSITPKVKGRFEHHKNTIVFVPEALQEATLYTVKLKKGLELQNSNQALKKDFIFRFETGQKDKEDTEYIDFIGTLNEFSSFEEPVLKVMHYDNNRKSSEEKLDTNVNIQVYRYENTRDFIDVIQDDDKPYWALYSRINHHYDTKNLEKVRSFNIDLQGEAYNRYLIFPEALEEGYYLIQGKKGEKIFQTHIQVTNISAYYTESETKTLFWVHNLASKEPIKEAKIEVDGKAYITGEDGIASYATIEKEDATEYRVAQISKGDMTPLTLILYPQYRFIDSYPNNSRSSDYLSYNFLDRGMYKPGDTVRFWGIIKHMKDINPKKITLELNKGYWRGNEPYIIKREITLLEDGTYEGEITLPNLREGHYDLSIKSGEERINSTTIQIEKYVKPAYKIGIDSDKKAIFSDQKINFDVNASFFEGTPVSNLELTYRYNDMGSTARTDPSGHLKLSYDPKDSSNSATQYYEHNQLYVHARLPEIGDISTYKTFFVFTKDQVVTAETEDKNNKGKVIIHVNDIDLTEINKTENGHGYFQEESILGKPVENKEVRVNLIKREWERIEDGVEYDFINKTTVKRYRYQTKNIHIESKVLKTDKEGKALYSFDTEEDGRYSVEIMTEDAKGRAIKKTVYVREYYNPWVYDGYELKTNKEEFKVGEKVELDFLKGDEPVQHRGDVLFYSAVNGIKGYELMKDPYYAFDFQEEDIPNIYIYGVAFNGKTYITGTSPAIKMNPLEKELEIKIKKNKKIYKPGEEVTLTIEAVDKNKVPTKARINISVVDEAFFSLRDQEVDILRNLYRTLASGIKNTYISHKYHSQDMISVRGYGDIMQKESMAIEEDSTNSDSGSEPRSVFKDTAIFKTVETDEKGLGQITFTLPHNITQWRVTYQGATKDLRARNGATEINATLPFFVDGIVNETYLEGDRPIIALNSYGNQVKEEERIQYEISAPTLGLNQFKTIEGKAFQQVYLELPTLKLGEHKIMIRGKSKGGHEDTVVKVIQVVNTYHTKLQHEFYELSNGLKINTGSKDAITTLLFSDLYKGKYYYDLVRLGYGSGARIDQVLTSKIAQECLKEYFERDEKDKANIDPGIYQLEDGGISLLPYSESDLELTAKIADLSSDTFDRAGMLDYFNTKLKEDHNKSAALYGMAVLGEPVLLELNALSQIDNLSIKDRLYLSLAYQKMNDQQRAVEIMNNLIKEVGEENEAYIRLDQGVDQDDILEITSLAAVAAARLDINGKDKLFAYISDHGSKDILINIEKLMFLKEELIKLPDTNGKFKYTLNGETKEVLLEKGRLFRLPLTPENLEKIQLTPLEGKVGINVSYEVAMNTFDGNKDKYASVERGYYNLKGEKTNTFEATDIVKVVIYPNLEEKAFEGMYEVVDILPSGLRPIEGYFNRVGSYDGHVKHPWRIEGQRVTFYTYSRSQYRNQPMVYYARVISKGDYNCERVMIQNTKTRDTASFSEKDQIVIK